VNAAAYRQALDALPYGKRLPGAVYFMDPGEDAAIPSLLRIIVAELRKRLEIGPEFNLLKFHTASSKVSFLGYPDFEKDPHPALKEAIIVDLVTGKVRRDDYQARANPPILHRKETFLPPEHLLHGKFGKLTRQEEAAGLLDDTAWRRTRFRRWILSCGELRESGGFREFEALWGGFSESLSETGFFRGSAGPVVRTFPQCRAGSAGLPPEKHPADEDGALRRTGLTAFFPSPCGTLFFPRGKGGVSDE
jgi:hypothetical protein